MNSLGKALKEARKLRFYTVVDVQNELGMSNAYISKLETGRIRNPSAGTLLKLANFYKIHINTLLLAAGIIKSGSENEPKEMANAEWLKIMAYYSMDFSNAERNELSEFAKFMLYKNRVEAIYEEWSK